jgi:hypothetical protein
VNVDFMDAGTELAPVAHRVRWIAWGLVLQVAGAGIPAFVVLERGKKDSVLGQISRYTVRLAWHEALRSPADVALMVFGLAAFVGGAVLVARPFARRRSTLFLLVPSRPLQAFWCSESSRSCVPSSSGSWRSSAKAMQLGSTRSTGPLREEGASERTIAKPADIYLADNHDIVSIYQIG